MLNALVDDVIWHYRYPVSFAGLRVLARTTVVRRADGKLFVHSPGPLDPALRHRLDELGTITHVCCPNRFHHLHVAAFRAAYPGARYLAAPGLELKRADFRFDGVIGEAPVPDLAGEFEYRLFEGLPVLNEVVWFHRPTATLLLTDLLFGFSGEMPPLKRLVTRLLGVHDRFAMSRTMKWLVRDREQARRSRDALLAWPFERVIIAHEDLILDDVRDTVAGALAWLG